jgi:hypothetical protein
MSKQPRVVKVLAALLVSMTTGAIVLMVLGNNPPSAGPFCLSAYYRLGSVDRVVRSHACQSPNRWSSIEIFFTGPATAAAIEHLTAARRSHRSPELNCHFVIGNGHQSGDGEIQATEKWQEQRSSKGYRGSEQTIRICLIGDGRRSRATDYQLKRLEMLLDVLCRKFNVPADSVYLPRDCQ